MRDEGQALYDCRSLEQSLRPGVEAFEKVVSKHRQRNRRTVNEVPEMEKFLALGVDGIISDFPEKFWKIRQRRR